MSDERSIEATPQRRQQARREGRFPRSQGVTIALLLMAVLAVAQNQSAIWLRNGGQALRDQLDRAPLIRVTQDVSAVSQRTLQRMVASLAPVLAGLLVMVWGIQVSQGGFVWLPQKVGPDVARLVPGLGRVFSWDRTLSSLMAGIMTCAGLFVLGAGLWLHRAAFIPMQRDTLLIDVQSTAASGAKVLSAVVAVVGLLTLAQYGLRLWRYNVALRMTPQELRDEQRGRTSLRVQSSAAMGGEDPQQRRAIAPSTQSDDSDRT